jgi:hypothetical protein
LKVEAVKFHWWVRNQNFWWGRGRFVGWKANQKKLIESHWSFSTGIDRAASNEKTVIADLASKGLFKLADVPHNVAFAHRKGGDLDDV